MHRLVLLALVVTSPAFAQSTGDCPGLDKMTLDQLRDYMKSPNTSPECAVAARKRLQSPTSVGTTTVPFTEPKFQSDVTHAAPR
jgi:hypothetical protein